MEMTRGAEDVLRMHMNQLGHIPGVERSIRAKARHRASGDKVDIKTMIEIVSEYQVLTHDWVVAEDKVVENNHDGTYTLWGYSVWGAIGQTGTPRKDVEIRPLCTKADYDEAVRIEKMMKRAQRTQDALVSGMRAKAVAL